MESELSAPPLASQPTRSATKAVVPCIIWENTYAAWTDHLIEWCRTHEAEWKKLFSDSTQDAQEEGRIKQQL
ncbi:hypothetical protein F5J12DRAFT_718819 [Pisolithus orientalis]|uniref:uncharacterized protein n=1 Tax=Pisolithus orientalis TaxID=936130 RepID=UPI00222503F3|nr:uncharacterized protein F5J12DRAFT_718819 [Pisolithus orientalis]KAI6010794.1 hypothetical protein F5J12DRAFT_718819 [Pisolithus orientalis]